MAVDLGEFKTRHTGNSIGRAGLASEVSMRLEAAGLSVSKIKARAVVDEVFQVMQLALMSGKRVEIRGFGTLRPNRRGVRRSFVPTKGKVVRVDARWVVKFDTSKEIKRVLMETLEG